MLAWRAILVLFAFAILSVAIPGGISAAILPFEDGFENIAAGDYPAENGWQNLFSGEGAYVSDQVAHGGNSSFRLESHPSWSRTDYVSLPALPDHLSYQVSVYIDPIPGRSAIVGFAAAFGNQGPFYNRFFIMNDDGRVGTVDFHGSQPGIVIGNFTVGNWVTVRADLDFLNLTASLWLDGELVAVHVPIVPKEFDDGFGHVILDKWGLSEYNWAGGGTGVTFFDDVRIWENPPSLIPSLMLDTVATSTCTPVQVKIFLKNNEPVEGFSFGVRHDPATIEAIDATWSGASTALRGGLGPEFFHSVLHPISTDCQAVAAGVIVAMIGSLSDPQGGAIPPSPGVTGQEVVAITYEPAQGVKSGAESALDFMDCFRSNANTEIAVCVVTMEEKSVLPERISGKVRIVSQCFKRGDCNDDGVFDVSDPIKLLTYLFVGEPKTPPCLEACNADDDENDLDVSDAIRMLDRLFIGSSPDPLSPPFQTCGPDPAEPPGALGCDSYTQC